MTPDSNLADEASSTSTAAALDDLSTPDTPVPASTAYSAQQQSSGPAEDSTQQSIVTAAHRASQANAVPQSPQTSRRRRRPSSSDHSANTEFPSQNAEPRRFTRTGLRGDYSNRSDGPRSFKRRRIARSEMRRDLDRGSSTTNGFDPSHSKSNGLVHTNGSSSHVNESASGLDKGKDQGFFGHDRQEVARLMIQTLGDLGYHDSASALVRESGHELESPTVAAFRYAVLNGEWAEAEAYLFGSRERDEGGVRITNGHSHRQDSLPLAEGVDKNELRFQLRRQKYLELLEQRDQTGALAVLRQELTPMHRDMSQLHTLSRCVELYLSHQHTLRPLLMCLSLVVCTPEELLAQTGWDGASGVSRTTLLNELSSTCETFLLCSGADGLRIDIALCNDTRAPAGNSPRPGQEEPDLQVPLSQSYHVSFSLCRPCLRPEPFPSPICPSSFSKFRDLVP